MVSQARRNERMFGNHCQVFVDTVQNSGRAIQIAECHRRSVKHVLSCSESEIYILLKRLAENGIRRGSALSNVIH